MNKIPLYYSLIYTAYTIERMENWKFKISPCASFILCLCMELHHELNFPRVQNGNKYKPIAKIYDIDKNSRRIVVVFVVYTCIIFNVSIFHCLSCFGMYGTTCMEKFMDSNVPLLFFQVFIYDVLQKTLPCLGFNTQKKTRLESKNSYEKDLL